MVNINYPDNWKFSERLESYGNSLYEHEAITFAGRKLEKFSSKINIDRPEGKAYVFRSNYWEDDEDRDIRLELEELLENTQVSKIEALTFGMMDDTFEADISKYIVNYLVNAKDRLTNLKAVFIGDITQEESEISWIQHDDISPVLAAYPNLEVLQIRGGDGLRFSTPLKHNNLQALIIETGGLSRQTIADIANLELPNLQHLELWLGTDNYGGDSTIEDLNWILSGNLSSQLIYLGLRNSEYSDDIAMALVNSPVLDKIKILDLSMGNLSDRGAEILLNSAKITNLDILNLSENFLSHETIESLKKLDIQVTAYDQKEAEIYEDNEIYRYCSVQE